MKSIFAVKASIKYGKDKFNSLSSAQFHLWWCQACGHGGLGRKWRLKYNRIYNRRFDSSKMDRLSEGRMTYTPIEDGLRMCVAEFLNDCQKDIIMRISKEAYYDMILHTHTKLSEFGDIKKKAKYIIARYTPYFAYKRIKNK